MLKQDLSRDVTLDGTVILHNFSQLENKPIPNDVTVSGIVISSNPALANIFVADNPELVNVFGKDIYFKEEQ